MEGARAKEKVERKIRREGDKEIELLQISYLVLYFSILPFGNNDNVNFTSSIKSIN